MEETGNQINSTQPNYHQASSYLSFHGFVRTERTTNQSRSILEMQLGDGRRLVMIIAALGRKGGTSNTGGALASCRQQCTRTAERRGTNDRSKHAHLDGVDGVCCREQTQCRAIYSSGNKQIM
jgi:hypothetical protein